jgi:hypothetical protein
MVGSLSILGCIFPGLFQAPWQPVQELFLLLDRVPNAVFLSEVTERV